MLAEYALLVGTIGLIVVLVIAPLAMRMSWSMGSLADGGLGHPGIQRAGADSNGRTQEALNVAERPDGRPAWLVVLGIAVIAGAATIQFLLFSRFSRKKAAPQGGAEEKNENPPRVKVGRLNQKRERIYRCIVRNTEALLRNEMLVEHVMSETLIRLDRTLPRDDVRGIMTTEHVHHVLVCDKAGVLLGVISDRDFQKTEAGTAEQLMTGSPIVAKRHDPLELAISTMIQHHISCLPVIDESGVLAGILTSSDLLLTLQCAFHLFERLNSSGAVGAASG